MDTNVLQQFDQDRAALLQALNTDPRQFAATLYSEVTTGPFWNRQTVTYSPYLSLNENQLCCLLGSLPLPNVAENPKVCIYSTRTLLPNQGKEGETYLITSGPAPLKYFVLKVVNIDKLEVIYLTSPPSSLPKDIPTTGLCLYPDIHELSYIGVDNFTNEYLTGFILDSVYTSSTTNPNRLDGIVHFTSATICNQGTRKRGAIMMEYADGGDLTAFIRNPNYAYYSEQKTYNTPEGKSIKVNSVQPSVIVEIFKQVIVNLDFLHKSLEFNHGDLKVSNLLMLIKRNQGTYEGITWNSPFTVQLADFSKSSMTIPLNGDKIRIFNYSSTADKFLTVFPFKPDLGSFGGEPYYRLDSYTNTTLLAKSRHAGVPYYFSFDTYTLIISLLLIPGFFYPIMTNEQLRKIFWDVLWFPDDYSTAYRRIYAALNDKVNPSYDTILSIIRDLKLKCRAHESIMTLLGRVQTPAIPAVGTPTSAERQRLPQGPYAYQE